MRATALCVLVLSLAAARPAVAGFEPPAGASPAEQAPDDLYRSGRDAIDAGRFDRAIADFTKLSETAPSRADAALYWLAYAQNKLGERAEALRTLAELQRRFAAGRWSHDAKALELEIRQASGQKVSPDTERDGDLKLLVLTNMSHTDPARTLAALEPLLASRDTSVKVQERALFVLSQMQAPQARAVLAKAAKDNGNADLQTRAVKYIGIVGGDQNRQLLADVYTAATSAAVKRAVLRGLMLAHDEQRLLTLAKNEASPDLRSDAVRQLGVMGARNALSQLYRSETALEVKKKVLNAMFVGGDTTALIDLAKSEKQPELRRAAVRDLGLTGAAGTGEALVSIYNTDPSPEIRKAAIDGLFLQNNAHALVTLARAEKDPDLKKDIVSKLSLMHSKEAGDYLMELLK